MDELIRNVLDELKEATEHGDEDRVNEVKALAYSLGIGID